MNNYEKMLAHVWIELNSKINKIESGEISPEDRAKLDAIPATASALNPVALASEIPDVTGLTNRVTTAEGEIDDIQAVIPSGASSSDKLALSSEIPDVTGLTNRVTTAEGEIDDIQAVIPSGASSSNKLATASDIPNAVNMVSYSIVLTTDSWSSTPDAYGYYSQEYYLGGTHIENTFTPLAVGTNSYFNLLDNVNASNTTYGVSVMCKTRTLPAGNVTFDLYAPVEA